MQRYYGTARDASGRAVAGAQVAVYAAASSTLATLYNASEAASDPTTTISNPLTTDALGNYSFAVPNGDYTIIVSGNGFPTEQRSYVNIWDGGASTGGPMTNPMSALGDMIYGGASGTPTALSGNTAASIKVLTQAGTGAASNAPQWNPTTGTGNAVFSASPTFTGTAVFTNATITGNIDAAGGTITLVDNVSALGSMAVTGNLTASAQLTVNGQANFNSTIAANAAVTNAITNPYRQWILKHSSTSNGAYTAVSNRSETYPAVANGVTNSSFAEGHFVIVQRNSSSGPSDANGTLASIYAQEISYGHLNAAAVAPVTNEITGLRMRQWLQTGSCTNFFGLKIENSGTGGSATTHYGIYIDPINFGATNYALYASSGLIKTTDATDTTALNTGSIQTAGGISAVKNIFAGGNLDVTGTATLRGSFVAVSNRLNLGSIAAPGNNGDIWQDSTQKSIGMFVDGIKQMASGTIFTQTADKTVANTVTPTSIIGTGVGTITLPANFWAVGKTIRLEVGGIISDTGTPTITMDIRFGSTVIATGTVTLPAGITNLRVDGHVTVTCRTTGATGTLIAGGLISILNNAGTVSHLPLIATAVTTVDTTTSQALDLFVTWGTASASNTITGQQSYYVVRN